MPKHPLSNVAGTGLEPVSESACAPRRSGYEPEVLLTSVKQKKDAEASSFNVAGTGLEPVSAAADMSPKYYLLV